MSSIATFIKDPDAVLDYTGDWSEWLDDDTIAESTWEIPAGITLDSEDATTTTVTIWLSGGTVGTKYELTNHIVTTAGREDDRTIKISVKER